MGSADCETGSSLEAVEFDHHKPFSIMDPHRPLLIDRVSHYSPLPLILFWLFHFIVLLLLSFFVPKDHSVDSALFRVNPTHLNITSIYRFDFSGFSGDSGRISLSLRAFRPSAAGVAINRIHFSGAAFRTGSRSPPTFDFPDPLDIHFMFSPGRYDSSSAAIWTIRVCDFSSASLNVSLTFHSPVSGIAFEWSIFDARNPSVRRCSCFAYSGFALLLAGFLIAHFQRRIEQLGTFIALFLFCGSAFNLSSDRTALEIVEKTLMSFLRVYLFYLISFIANKHRNFIAGIGFVLIFIAFLCDLVCCWHSLRGALDIVHGHDIAMHCVLCAVLCSMVAAMHFFAEDALAFLSYAALLALCLVAPICTADASIVWPHIVHSFEPRIALTGVHALVVATLFYFHQGIDRFADAPSDFALL
jgi:hypothetical protein